MSGTSDPIDVRRWLEPATAKPGLTRRDALRLARNSGLLAGAGFWSGCERSNGSDRSAAKVGGDIEGAIRVIAPSESIDPAVLAYFEREGGIAITFETYESEGELETSLSAAEEGFDVCLCGGTAAGRLIAAELLSEIDRDRLANLGHLAPEFLDPPWDPGNRFTIPFAWGMTGIAYRADKVEVPPHDLSVFFDSRYRRKMTMLADGREVMGAMLQRRGESRNCRDSRKLELAKADAIAVKKNLRAFVPSSPRAHLLAGEVWVAQLGNDEAASLRRKDAAIEWVLPRDGGRIWQDVLAIPRDAPNRASAHEFVDFLIRPEVSAKLGGFSGRGTPNRTAQRLVATSLPYPTTEERKRLEYDLELGRDQALWDRLWRDVEAAVG